MIAYPWRAYPSGWTSGFDGPDRTLVDPVETIGAPNDAIATSPAQEASLFGFGKAILGGLGVAAGSGTGVINTNRRVNHDPLVTLGDGLDAVATDAGVWSAISLLKGIYAVPGVPN